jgi:uncharacterized protein (TIGR02452 family)
MDREGNRKIFLDTLARCNTDPDLMESVRKSIGNQLFIPETGFPVVPVPRFKDPCTVRITRKRTLEAAGAHKGRVAVLNFASWTNPGGGVESGSDAQEESLCRVSTLFPCLSDKNMMQRFYIPHRSSHNPLNNDDCIYTGGVTVFRSDSENPVLLPKARRYEVDVITCAAPNLREREGKRIWVGDRLLLETHIRRISRILDIAAVQGDTCVVLGAFGCGAFMNDPEIVALACRKAIQDRKHMFSEIEFAIYDRKGDNTKYNAFRRILS